MTTFAEQINSFAARVGAECKALHTAMGALASLNTTDKTSLVAAINEVKAAANVLNGTLNDYSGRLTAAETATSVNTGDITTLKSSVSTLQFNVSGIQDKIAELEGVIENSTGIDDTKVSSITTYSSTKIVSEINAAKQAVKNDLLDGVGTAYDTLKELGAAIEANKDLIESFEEIATGHVKFDGAQSLTDSQKSQARTNIGAASVGEVSTLSGTVGGHTTAINKNTADIKTLNDNLGDITSANLVATFEANLA